MSPKGLIVKPQTRPLRGTITVPGDKSISHRAVMLGALAEGVSTVRDWLPAGDTLATLDVIQALGVEVSIDRRSPTAWDLVIHGRGLRGLVAPGGPLDCRNAGTAIRLLAGILAGQAFPTTLDGSLQLRKRPMGRVVGPLREMGANITATDGHAPLTIRPGRLQGIAYDLPVASAQVKSAVLLAGLFAAGETRVHQPGPTRDHTERMLAAMGVETTQEDGWVTLPAAPRGERRLRPLDMTVPGDISSAAFPLVAATITPHSDVTICGVGLNETRTGLIDILQTMGVQIEVSNLHLSGGEPVGDLRVRYDELHATDVAGEAVVRSIDEFPIWAVAATQAAGDSTVAGAAELRVKEVDRIGVLAAELRRMGVPIVDRVDGFTVSGPVQPPGGDVDSHDDHRLAMALAVAGLAATGPTTVRDATCAADSFPGFVETMQRLGAEMAWADA
jgi:3-phosphoshikimate 1-carboxyvinyltransferase